ncbi:hypothetical protein [uncultured Alsobacter sp.]|uniref:hypothetical protein n=1 Tax=uncultured Alsobacter sp. TaxID=1748258 RepID=UPI0025E31158|nr:hypothetical protein [uncultured Alsobacter sp.]
MNARQVLGAAHDEDLGSLSRDQLRDWLEGLGRTFSTIYRDVPTLLSAAEIEQRAAFDELVAEVARRPRQYRVVQPGVVPEGVLDLRDPATRTERLVAWRTAVFTKLGGGSRVVRIAWIVHDLNRYGRPAYISDRALQLQSGMSRDAVERALQLLALAGAIIRAHVPTNRGGFRRNIWLAARIAESDQPVDFTGDVDAPVPAKSTGTPTRGFHRGEPAKSTGAEYYKKGRVFGAGTSKVANAAALDAKRREQSKPGHAFDRTWLGIAGDDE